MLEQLARKFREKGGNILPAEQQGDAPDQQRSATEILRFEAAACEQLSVGKENVVLLLGKGHRNRLEHQLAVRLPFPGRKAFK